MMIKDYILFIDLPYIHMVQMLEKYAKQSWWMHFLGITKYKITNFDDVTNGNKTEHYPKWPYIPDHP